MFVVPASAGPFRLKAGLRTKLAQPRSRGRRFAEPPIPRMECKCSSASTHAQHTVGNLGPRKEEPLHAETLRSTIPEREVASGLDPRRGAGTENSAGNHAMHLGTDSQAARGGIQRRHLGGRPNDVV